MNRKKRNRKHKRTAFLTKYWFRKQAKLKEAISFTRRK